jgi:AraC family transcriptional regulator
MPARREIVNTIGTELYSVEVYPPLFYKDFNPNNEFEKWAAVEVADTDVIPAGMEAMVIPQGLYAVFTHIGPQSEGAETYRYIFMDWLPASGYEVDERPHFAVMGDKYRPASADSEEEIWIPVKTTRP